MKKLLLIIISMLCTLSPVYGMEESSRQQDAAYKQRVEEASARIREQMARINSLTPEDQKKEFAAIALKSFLRSLTESLSAESFSVMRECTLPQISDKDLNDNLFGFYSAQVILPKLADPNCDVKNTSDIIEDILKRPGVNINTHTLTSKYQSHPPIAEIMNNQPVRVYWFTPIENPPAHYLLERIILDHDNLRNPNLLPLALMKSHSRAVLKSMPELTKLYERTQGADGVDLCMAYATYVSAIRQGKNASDAACSLLHHIDIETPLSSDPEHDVLRSLRNIASTHNDKAVVKAVDCMEKFENAAELKARNEALNKHAYSYMYSAHVLIDKPGVIHRQ